MPDSVIENIPAEILTKVQDQYIYFGHQSVGFNILDGISDLTDSIDIQNLDDYSKSDKPVFLHSQVGKNYNPQSKLDDFSFILSKDIGETVNTAFLKFCYVDINENSDVDDLFDYYSNAYDNLNKLYPHITFVHFTVPLMSQQKGLKAIIKKIMGRDVYGFKDNLKRQIFNDKVRQNYDIVFDIAKIESTKPDRTRMIHSMNNQTYYSMYPAYTDDGGHLNKKGRKIVARELLLFLSNL